MKITVIGNGRWGSFLAWYCARENHTVLLYGRKDSSRFQELQNTRKNKYLTLPDRVSFTTDLSEALREADRVIISISSQQLPDLMQHIKETGYIQKTFILCMKGIIESTGQRLSEVVRQILGDQASVAIWVGPGHVENFTAGIPNCMLIAAQSAKQAQSLAKEFSGNLIRFYHSDDLVGCEIGAAAKNVIGIAAGMLDGSQLSTLKGALMARGAREVSRLVTAMGGKEITVYGLSHIGDYEATLFSLHSHNRQFGENFITGKPYHDLAEGVGTLKALQYLAQKYNVEMPITEALYRILFENQPPKEALQSLFFREMKAEF